MIAHRKVWKRLSFLSGIENNDIATARYILWLTGNGRKLLFQFVWWLAEQLRVPLCRSGGCGRVRWRRTTSTEPKSSRVRPLTNFDTLPLSSPGTPVMSRWASLFPSEMLHLFLISCVLLFFSHLMSSLFDHPNNIWRRAEVMKRLVFLSTCCAFHLRRTYSPHYTCN